MDINIIGVPIFYGADRKGAELGPQKLREKNIVDVIGRHNHRVFDFGNLFVPVVQEREKFYSHPNMKYLEPVIHVNNNLAHIVYSSIKGGSFPLVLGGDHYIGLGSIAGVSRAFRNFAVVWVDAHGDINTYATSGSGNIHGMSLAKSMGIGDDILTDVYFKGKKVEKQNVFIVGARDLDPGEYDLIKAEKLHVYTTERIREKGIEHTVEEVLRDIKDNDIDAIHLSFDIDFIDANLVPGTGTAVAEGPDIEDARTLLKLLAETKLVKSMDFVELNPLLDKHDITADVAMDLLDLIFKYI